MRKTLPGAACFLTLALVLGSCSQQAPERSDVLINDIINGISSENAEKGQKTAAMIPVPETKASAFPGNPETASGTGEAVDIDLTQMNTTMVYSVIYDLMIKPNDYYGKSLMVDGYFDTVVNEQLGTRYFFVVVPDATACCAQGLEFLLPDGKKYPEDYPEPGAGIRVRGVLGNYEEAGQPYAYIKADQLILL